MTKRKPVVDSAGKAAILAAATRLSRAMLNIADRAASVSVRQPTLNR